MFEVKCLFSSSIKPLSQSLHSALESHAVLPTLALHVPWTFHHSEIKAFPVINGYCFSLNVTISFIFPNSPTELINLGRHVEKAGVILCTAFSRFDVNNGLEMVPNGEKKSSLNYLCYLGNHYAFWQSSIFRT